MSTPTPNKVHKVPSSGHTYHYIYHPTSSPQKPTLLFIHGFPSTSDQWRHQIAHFKPQDYGILVPDLLGYGNTSKPTSPSSYKGSIMSADIISIMDHENITGKVIGISHDWGTYLMSQLAIYYPERFDKYVFMSAPHSPPGRAMDVHTLNKVTKKKNGYEQFGYWLFFTADRAGKTLGNHWHSFFEVAYCADPSVLKTHFAPTDGLENFITSNSTTPLASFITPEDKVHHHAVFGDDYSACLNWYRRGITNLGVEEEVKLLKEGKIKEKIAQETLMIAGLKDVVSGAQRARVAMTGCVEKGKLAVVDIDAGHWIMMEKEEETNRALQDFFKGGVARVGGAAGTRVKALL